jgi:hypothetical protein
MMQEMQRFQELSKQLEEVFGKTANPLYAEARLLGTLQVLIPHVMDTESLGKLNGYLTNAIHEEMMKILAQEHV